MAAITRITLRITGGNFRALNPLPPGSSKFSNAPQQVTKTVEEAARASVIGHSLTAEGNLTTA